MVNFLDEFANFLNPETSPITYGPKFIPMNYIINFQKAGTLFFGLLLMIIYNNFTTGAWVYLALHGSYGMVWFIKDLVFGDKAFRLRIDILQASLLAGILAAYWLIVWIMMSGRGSEASNERIFFAIFNYVIGLCLTMFTDLQKYITLRFRKGLIDDGFLSNNRNTNYLGEMMLYLSFAIMTGNVYSYLILIVIWSVVFIGRIHLKEMSLRRKENFKQYERNSYCLLFKFFDNDFYNVLLYGAVIFFFGFLYMSGGFEQTLKKLVK